MARLDGKIAIVTGAASGIGAASARLFADEGANIRVATSTVRLTVAKEMSHDPTCGGKQWFHPLSAVNDAMMGTTAENAFSGTSLGTKWSEPDKHSSFFGTFSY